MIRLESVGKRFPSGQVAVRDLTLEVRTGETCVLIGPSGSGKTTTLKMINRLIEPTSGRIFHDDEDVTHIDPVRLRLRMGYVIQNVGLFPHLNVADNVATVPRLLAWGRDRIRRRVDELLELVELDPTTFRDRYPHQLSGGQRQRVGVARALAVDPPVLLMDEPFGAVDRINRDRLQNEFLRIQSEVRKTVILVTHDIDEAVKLGDRIAILRQGGVLEQYDTPLRILASPASGLVAELLGHDRGLKRLAITPIEPSRLEQPPLLAPETPLAEARRVLDAQGVAWAVVLDGASGVYGELARAQAQGDGTAHERARRVSSRVFTGDTLGAALEKMLLEEAGWVPVFDGERLRGVLTPHVLQASLQHPTNSENAPSSP